MEMQREVPRLKLDLNDLRVDSFATTPMRATEGGTTIMPTLNILLCTGICQPPETVGTTTGGGGSDTTTIGQVPDTLGCPAFTSVCTVDCQVGNTVDYSCNPFPGGLCGTM